MECAGAHALRQPEKQRTRATCRKVRGSLLLERSAVGAGDLRRPARARKRSRAARRLGFYSAAWERDGATNQATTRTEKLANAAAIISGLLRLNLWDLTSRFIDWKSM